MVQPIDCDQQQFDVYERGRELPSETVDAWMRGFVRRVREERPLSVLDLGSGTGRFTPALAQTFGGPVHGVEPADRMRAIAERSARHPRVTYLDGAAERIPLPDTSCDLVVMYAARLRLRAVSTFEHLTEKEIAAGFAALDHAVVTETRPRPVEADLDLLVLSRHPLPTT